MHIEFALTWWEFKHTKTHYLHKLFSLVWNGLPCFSNVIATCIFITELRWSLLIFHYYVWFNSNHSEPLIGSVRDLPSNMHCLLLSNMPLWVSTFRFVERPRTGNNLFSVFCVIGVGAITFRGSFSYLTEEESGLLWWVRAKWAVYV